ncbi:MAG: hypothetical protein ACYTHK_07960 [Planctomycetota bacterium]|jgi:hypothetical protein
MRTDPGSISGGRVTLVWHRLFGQVTTAHLKRELILGGVSCFVLTLMALASWSITSN